MALPAIPGQKIYAADINEMVSDASDAAASASSAQAAATAALNDLNAALDAFAAPLDAQVDFGIDRAEADGRLITGATAQAAYGVSVHAFGAVGDGVTDDTTALQNAFNTPLTRHIRIPDGTYRATAQLTLSADLTIDAEPGAVLDISGVPDSIPALNGAGTYAAAVTLSADATVGSSTVTVTSATGIAVGDVLKVSSSQVFGSTSQPRGEFVRVLSVAGTTVTLEDPLQDDYAAASGGQVEKLTPLENVTVRGLRIVGPSDVTKHVTGIKLTGARNVLLTGISTYRCHTAGVYLFDVLSSRVLNSDFDSCDKAGFGYGVTVSYCSQDVAVIGCTGSRLRHLLTVGGGMSLRGVPRRVTVADCTASQVYEAGFDAHPAGEDISFSNCHVLGSPVDGFTIQCGRFTLTGCTVANVGRHGIFVQPLTIRGVEGAITGCVVSRAVERGIAVSISATVDYAVWSGLSITGNNVRDSGFGIAVENTNAGLSVEGVAVTGNTIRRCVTNHALYLRGCTRPVVQGNNVHKPAGTGETLYLLTCPGAVVSGNALDGAGTTTRALRLVASPRAAITGNRMTGAATGVLSDSASAPLIVMGNSNDCTTKHSLGGSGNIISTADASGAYNLL